MLAVSPTAGGHGEGSWYDEWLPVHRHTPEAAYLAKLEEPAAAPRARELVGKIRAEIVALFANIGAASA